MRLEAATRAGNPPTVLPGASLVFLTAYFLVALAVFVENGHFHPLAIVLLVGAAGLLVSRAVSPGGVDARGERLSARIGGLALPSMLACFLVLGFWPAGAYLTGFEWVAGTWGPLLVALLFAMTYFPEGSAPERLSLRLLGSWRARSFLVLAVIGLGLKICLLLASPQPLIDVWTILQEGAEALARGENPYAVTFIDPYLPGQRTDAYVYLPLVLWVTAPFRWLLGEVRVAQLACETISFWLLWRIARPREPQARPAAREAELFALLFLFHPRALFVLEQSWTEPIVVTLFLGLLWCLRERRPVAASILAGLFLAAKQYVALLAPLLWLGARALRLRWSQIAGCATLALVVATAVTLPLALWDPRAFVDDVLLYHLNTPLRDDALNLTTVFYKLLGHEPPGFVSAALAVGALGLGLASHRRANSPAGLASAAGMVLLWALLFQKHAFCNYYYLVGAILLAAAALFCAEARDAGRPARTRNGAV